MENFGVELLIENINTGIKDILSVNNLNINDSLSGSKALNRSLPIDMQFNSGHIISVAVHSVLFVLSSIGNLTVLIAILRRRCRGRFFSSKIDILLVHLAIADLMVTCFMMPLEIGWAATVQWKAGDGMCRIMASYRIFGLYLSGFVLVCMAADRYMAVCFPLQGLASNRRVKVMLVIAWFLSILCSLPQVIIFHVERHPLFTWYTQCVTYDFFTKPEHELLYNLFVMMMMYTLPFILLVLLYGSIAFQLWKEAYSTTKKFGFQGGLRRSGVNNFERAKVKSIQMTLVITATFLVCWTPYYVMCVWYWIDAGSAKNVDQRIQKGLFLFASTNSTVNSIIYGMFHLNSLLGKRTTRRLAEQNETSQSLSNLRTNSSLINANGLYLRNDSSMEQKTCGRNETSATTQNIYGCSKVEYLPLLVVKRDVIISM